MKELQKFGMVLVAVCLFAAPEGLADQGPAQHPAKQATGPVSGLKLPRFVSLKFDKVRLRHGPGLKYRIDWDYVNRRGMPVEIIAEVDNWRRIRDIDGDEGWVHSSQLSSTRGVIVTGKTASVLRRQPEETAPSVALADPGVIGNLKSCREGWCRITIQGYTGWLPRPALWGLFPHEEGID